MSKLAGKIAVVTGGTTGIGLATARRFADEGARVYITGRRKPELDAAVQEIGKGAVGVQGDVSNLADLDRLYAKIEQEVGRIDVLFANAGGAKFAPLGAITEEHYDQTFDINVKGLLFSVQKALPLFKEGGSIILNASIVSIKGLEALSVYSATKAAVRSFARSWTVDLKGRNIRVNVVSPGPIDTPAIDGLAGNEEAARQFKQQMALGVPMGRIGEPDEIAKAVVFLASDDSSFVSGIELFVDGGMAQI
ncbi:SDR family NAD(P)-dependent oxidoreductase [Fimbriimonas ginsengisoli]|uniref:Short-chain dehydrogenase/reductase SDR n=1 Tax=Fimbriimonas ginsengisoli Gsoil 348 TaxID=661478 RepID=A0A068NLV6_FIMGI|nr:glucose 1-dehydrogenase [Fimbriimonas ginsengisoli]AIE84528.1 short-chain dehydrogenase/reductase SDR [Fimbriimonas ginsengisoli Gsoil 348]